MKRAARERSQESSGDEQPKYARHTLPSERRVRWRRSYRLVPSRYPPIDLFESLADPADWELLAEIEGLTNDRVREQTGQIALVPLAERVAGPGASPIMAAFTHIGFPSRFSDGTFGVYYASDRLQGALAEVLHHRTVFLQATREPKTQFDLRAYLGALDAKLHDVRDGFEALHHPASYQASQAMAAQLRSLASNGLVFRSVRDPGSQNVAVFRPSVLAAKTGPHTVQGPHLRVEWDGAKMDRYIVMGEPSWRSLPS